MTYIRDPRNPLVWESDGEYNGKYMALDGTLHDSAYGAWERDDAIAEELKSGKRVEKTSHKASDGGER